MSYYFPVDSRFSGDIGAGNVFNTPINFVASFVKYPSARTSFRYVCAAFPDSDGTGGHSGILTGGSDGVFLNRLWNTVDQSGPTSPIPTTPANYYDQWVPLLALNRTTTGTNNSRMYRGAVGGDAEGFGQTNATTDRALSALRYFAVGDSLTGFDNFAGHVAEVVFGKFEPTAQEITDYLSGISANTVWSARSDYYYYPFNSENTSQADASGNGGPTLTITLGTPTYSADHPTITGDTAGEIVTEPLYYVATLLANKTNIKWAIREGHDDLIGTLLGSGTTGTTNGSGVFIPNGTNDFGDPATAVTLFLEWKEGSAPIVDRSLIVTTTLTAPA